MGTLANFVRPIPGSLFSSTTLNPQSREILERAQQHVRRMLNFRIPYDPRRDELFRHFIGRGRESHFPDRKTKRSNVFVPYAFSNVRQVKSAIMSAFFSIDPPFEVLPRTSRDVDAAPAMQAVLHMKVMQEAKLRQVMDEFITGLCIYGHLGLGCEWDWDYDLMPTAEDQPQMNSDGTPVINPLTQQPHIARQWGTQKIPRNRPKFSVIDIYDLAEDPDGAYVVQLFDKTITQLRREQEMSKGGNAAANGLYDDAGMDELERQLATLVGKTNSPEDIMIRIAALWDRVNGTYTLFTFNEAPELIGYKDARYANQGASYAAFRREQLRASPILLAHRTNPFLHRQIPILTADFTKVPGAIYGLGTIEPCYSINETLNRAVNMIMDNWDIGINKRYAYDALRDVNLDELANANVPGGLVGVFGNPDDVLKELGTHTPTPGDYNILPVFKNMMELTSGVSDFYQRGIGSGGSNDTASGIQSVIQQSNKPLMDVVQSLNDKIFEPLLQMSASMCQQYLTDDIEVRITDEQQPSIPKLRSQFVAIKPEDLAGNFDFHVVGPAYMDNPFIQQRNALALANMLNQVAPQYLKPYESLKELFRIFRVANPNRFLKTEEEVAADQQRQQMMQMLMGGAPQGGPQPQTQSGSPQRRPAQPEGQIPGAPISGPARTQGQNLGANALGLGGLGEATPGVNLG